ncbi:XRE family transcriptional regulator [Paenibacillus mucilaginosus K02]|uniref:XRE family transcriptional regulator n=1 Tax=Paenibacillus mucilaginosus K02 TaxID=997761 RepID=I0BDY3_9BACL|nr:XRE family transcriptional regulator [Paenibacillus mucilaginosus K02]
MVGVKKAVIKKEVLLSEMKRKKVLSMKELASNTGISQSTLSLIMNGKRSPGSKVIGSMIAYFECSFERLFFYDTPLTKVNNK